MAKSRNRKEQKDKSAKRTTKAAREVMHQMKRDANMNDNINTMNDNINTFIEIMKEYASEKGGN
jgi:hypothetical protein